MNPGSPQLAQEYDTAYQQAHFFNHQASAERPFLGILCQKAGLKPGASVLDAGCGQGFFTWLFAELGFKATGVDISQAGILMAQKEYGQSGAAFEVGDITALSCREPFDCVFARCFSLYNSQDFEMNRHLTDIFLSYLKPGGIFIFFYYTILNPQRKSTTWVYHSMKSVRRHFSEYAGTRIYFSRRAATSLVGMFTLSRPVTLIDCLISRITGSGGYAVALVKRR